jgi:hypothetical protein
MSGRTNMTFFKAYIELENACAARLGVDKHGVSAYINRLVEMRFAKGRSETLPKLIKYRNFRNKIAHEEGAMKDLDGITKADIQWLSRFTRLVNKRRDPVSLYENKARRYIIWRKFRIAIIAAGSVLGVAFVLWIIHLMGFI